MEKQMVVVIMAGGQGTRFWPISRKSRPKQFLQIGAADESLIQATAGRAAGITDPGRVLVVGNAAHESLLREHVPSAKVVCEPDAKNTAAALGLSALHVRRLDPGAVMVALPADHMVSDEERFRKTIHEAARIAAEQDVLVTVGIVPTFPHTDYGYIRRGERLHGTSCRRGAYMVSRFFEKPSLQRARVYFGSDEFYWNSGIFLWRPEVLLAAIHDYMPELHEGLMRIDRVLGTAEEAAALNEVYERLEPVSIDFGVMEHARNCVVIDAEPFGWDDVGSWDAWAEHLRLDEDGNAARGDAVFIDSSGCIVHSEHRCTAVLGAEDLVIIDSADALLVCPRDHVQDIKKIVSELRKRGRGELV